MSSLSHLDSTGAARMVDVSAKPVVAREAVAEGHIRLQPVTLDLIRAGKMPKGEVLATARIAGIQAAKRTADWIPLCHPLPLTGITVVFSDHPEGLTVTATVRTTARTGVEMEALTAVSATTLTLYDMCKAVDKTMSIEGIRLLSKTKAESGT
ncbi:MAG: cyclic pyranopterin monophosphate synthase MoaC [Verrucomicrobiota bacterium]